MASIGGINTAVSICHGTSRSKAASAGSDVVARPFVDEVEQPAHLEIGKRAHVAQRTGKLRLAAFGDAGETADEFTLRTVECIGGCGWATIVAVNNRHRLRVSADDVPGIVEELRGL